MSKEDKGKGLSPIQKVSKVAIRLTTVKMDMEEGFLVGEEEHQATVVGRAINDLADVKSDLVIINDYLIENGIDIPGINVHGRGTGDK